MQHDIGLGWKSPVPIGSYVVISYGNPGTNEHKANWETDSGAQGETKISYNSTLWEKVYDQSLKSNNGIGYRLIMSMAGLTPKIDVTSEWIDANRDPLAEIDQNSDQATNPRIKFSLPRSQNIGVGTVKTGLNVGENTAVTVDTSVSGSINFPLLNFNFPKSQQIRLVTSTVVSPMANPSVSFINNATNMAENGSKNYPILHFSLPRSVRFNFGTLVSSTNSNSNIIIDNSSNIAQEFDINDPPAKGDWYINSKFGYVYIVESVGSNNSSITFSYKGSLQRPLPNVSTNVIPPYIASVNGSYVLNSPNVVKIESDKSNDNSWSLDFSLPNLPKLEACANFIGPIESAKNPVEVSIKDEATTKFTFWIPRGSRTFFGTTVHEGQTSINVIDSMPGDFYLNEETGDLYYQDYGLHWELVGSLRGEKGDKGEPLKIVRSYNIVGPDTNFQAGVDAIEGDPKNSNITSNQIFVITFTNDGTTKIPTSFFYFKLENGDWDRSLLTGTGSGGIGNIEDFIFNEYQESKEPNAITDKTYSVDYINKLIGGTIDSDNMDKTAFSKDQIYYLLSWGTFEDAINGIDIPTPENKDTLSAEEVLKLISWGQF